MAKSKNFIKAVVFLCIAVVLFILVNIISQPVWLEWNNYDTIQGFYKEPENTIETLFLGTSTMSSGVIPQKLYEEYGICAYNLATEQQPMFSSYYLMRETYRLHADTLDTVVLDVSNIRRQSGDAFYRKTLDSMHLSSIKLEALYNHKTDFNDLVTNLVPVFSYHTRWKELSEFDFAKSSYEPESYYRGYELIENKYLDVKDDYKQLAVPTYYVDETATPAKVNEESKEYLGKIIQFCNDNDIKLLLIKTPQYGVWSWGSSEHIAMQNIADEYGVTFMDLSFSPYQEEFDYNIATDTKDARHMNIDGATKFTSYIGKILTEEYGNKNIKGDEDYAFMADELDNYNRSIIGHGLDEINDPVKYLEQFVNNAEYSVIVNADSAELIALRDAQKQYLEGIGLTEIANPDGNSSYFAIVHNGKTMVSKTYDYSSDGEVKYTGTFTNGEKYSFNANADESILTVRSEDYSMKKSGINIALFDDKLGTIVDSTSINLDTETVDKAKAASERKESLYEQACINAKWEEYVSMELEKNDYDAYLESCVDHENYIVYVSGIDKAGNSKLLVKQGRNILQQQDGTGNIEISSGKYNLVSGTADGKISAAINIDSKNYAADKTGINVVVYDSTTETVIGAESFH